MVGSIYLLERMKEKKIKTNGLISNQQTIFLMNMDDLNNVDQLKSPYGVLPNQSAG